MKIIVGRSRVYFYEHDNHLHLTKREQTPLLYVVSSYHHLRPALADQTNTPDRKDLD
jgi:hypothetical protein